MFIAHRGNDNHKYRENSENALLYSLSQTYIDGVECDIRLTKDNEIVLLHNMLIDFKSDGNGFVHNLTLNELLSYLFENERVTVLKDLLSKIDSKKILLLEIKEERSDSLEKWIEALKPILLKHSYLNIYLCSFNYDLLIRLKEYFDVPIGIIVGYVMNQSKDISLFDFVMYHYRSFKYIHKVTMVWTINDKEKFKKYNEKTDYIITDKAYQFV